jgi:hypothetical protein
VLGLHKILDAQDADLSLCMVRRVGTAAAVATAGDWRHWTGGEEKFRTWGVFENNRIAIMNRDPD